MEGNKPSPEEHTKKDQSTTDIEWPSILATWFERPEPEKPEQADTDNEKDSKTGKFKKFFSKLFGRTVEKPILEQNEETERSRSRLVELFLGAKEQDPAHEAPEPQAASREQVVHQSSEVPQALSVERDSNPAVEQGPVFNAEQGGVTATPEVPADVDVQEAIAPQSIAEATAQERILEQQHHEAVTQPEAVRVVERPDRRVAGTVAAIAAAEYLANRHTVRKAERRIHKEVKKVEKETKKTQEATRRVEQATRLQTEQLEKIVHDKRQPERVVRVEQQPARVEGLAQARYERPVMSSPERIDTRETVVERAGAPDKVLERVSAAAEHNEPIERLYERRQEIKDEPTQDHTLAGAAAVGDVLSRANGVASAAKAQADAQVAAQKNLQAAQLGEDYRAVAVRSGIVGGLVIVVFAVIAYFAMH